MTLFRPVLKHIVCFKDSVNNIKANDYYHSLTPAGN